MCESATESLTPEQTTALLRSLEKTQAEIKSTCDFIKEAVEKAQRVSEMPRPQPWTAFIAAVLTGLLLFVAGWQTLCALDKIGTKDPWLFAAAYAIFAIATVVAFAIFARMVSEHY